MRSLLTQDDLYVCSMATQQSGTVASAANININTIAIELLEHILFQLSPLQALEAKAINKRFKTTIDDSPKIQNKINFRDVSPLPSENGVPRVSLNPAIFSAPINIKRGLKGFKLVGLNWFRGYLSIGHDLVQGVVDGRGFNEDSSCKSMALCMAFPGQTKIEFRITGSASSQIAFSLHFGPGATITLDNVAGAMNRLQQVIEAQNQGVFRWTGIVIIRFPDGTQIHIGGDKKYGLKDEKLEAEDSDDVVCTFHGSA